MATQTSSRVRRIFPHLKHLLFLTIILLTNSGCSIGYIAESAYYQIKLLNNREPIEEVLKKPELNETTKNKLELAQKAHRFSFQELGLKESDNYKTFVQLEQKYVTYIVAAAPKNKLEHYTWWFPIVGSVPYKGYFYPEGAKSEAEELKKENLDVYTRGVSAYSTLGWFNDPLLSSMMRYDEYNLVNTIIHENVHATIFIEGSSNFNERLATFIGNLGAQKFFEKYSEKSDEILNDVNHRKHDEKIFSQFISKEITDLKAWYNKRANTEINEDERQNRLSEINDNFIKLAKPQMKSKRYNYFEKVKLNNAVLMQYKLYVSDLSDFEELYNLMDQDFSRFLKFCKGLEESEDPVKAIKSQITLLKSNS